MRKLLLFLISVFLLPLVLGVGGWDEGGWDEGGWDFGTPATPEPAPSSSSSSGGGGGGGGLYAPKDSNQSITYRLNLIKNQKYDFSFNGDFHKISITKVDVNNKTAVFTFESEKILIPLKIKEAVLFNYNYDNYNDLEITLNEIYGNDAVEVIIKTIHTLIESPKVEAFASPETPVETPTESIGGLNIVEEPITIEKEPQQPVKEKKFWIWIFTGIIFLILFIVSFKFGKYVIATYFKKRQSKEIKKEDDTNKRDKRENQH